MCVIVRKPQGKTFTNEEFASCWRRNKHGLGFVALNGTLVKGKGLMDEKVALETVSKFFGPQYDLVLHFRIQSRGGVSENLTHPFDCSQPSSDVERLLFHNGTVKNLSVSPSASDTQLLSTMLSIFDDSDLDKFLKVLVEKKSGRFVLVYYNKKTHESKIDIYEEHTNSPSKIKDGIWFSNDSHSTFVGIAPDYGDDYYYYQARDLRPKNEILFDLLTSSPDSKGDRSLQTIVDEIIADAQLNKLADVDVESMKKPSDLIKFYTLQHD